MSLRPSTVLVLWLLANAALAVMLVAFREHPLAYILYFVATVPLLTFGLAVLRAGPEFSERERLVLHPAGAIVFIAAGLTLVGLGIIFATWLAIVGGVVTLGALGALRIPERER